MSELKHTPGPWQHDNEGRITDLDDASIAECIIHPVYRVGDGRMQSDARLIAAAPELLAACNQLLQVVQQLPLESPLISEGHTAAKVARAAIAKTERT